MFQPVWAMQKGLDAVFNAEEAWIIAQLPEELKHKIAVINYDYHQDLALEVGNLTRPHELHVRPKQPGRRADSMADTLEDILS
ncbi:hypothetical protein OE165_27665, partial [Escherichia coli]|uniref:hypothetical protein n=1 Tax=Escherichia coli TaxID=562 RepID=UPI0021F2677C